jgi:hypothetical protein
MARAVVALKPLSVTALNSQQEKYGTTQTREQTMNTSTTFGVEWGGR